MFFKDDQANTNITTATPERVYSLVKHVERKKTIKTSELKELIEPSYAKNGNYYSTIRDVAIDLGLISMNDNYIQLAVDPNAIRNIDAMRSLINGNMDQFQNGLFYAITKAYFSLNEKLFEKMAGSAEGTTLISNLTKKNITEPVMRGWRFWAAFLGFGYLEATFLIPNCAVFMKDLIDRSDLERKKDYSVREVIEAISPNVEVVFDDSSIIKKTLTFGATAGIYTLEELGIIKTEKIQDHVTWNLYGIKKSDNTISNIRILKKERVEA